MPTRTVLVDVSAPGPTGPVPLTSDSKVQFTLTKRLKEGSTLIVPESVSADVGTSIDLEVTPAGWAYRVTITTSQDSHGPIYVLVNPGTTTNLVDLPVVDPKTLDVVDPGPAWWAVADGIVAARDAAQAAATSASQSASAAAQSATAADGSATTASTKAGQASSSASAAAGSASTASTKAGEASASATSASNSATSAGQAKTAAEAARDAALAQNFLGANLGQDDLNTKTTPGLYRQATGTDATAARNYPKQAVGGAGVLEVLNVLGSGGFCVQRYIVHGGVANNLRAIYLRRWNNSAWSEWVPITSNSVVQPAGQPGSEVSTWDDTNGRYQALMAYGYDLGTADLNAVTTPGIYYQLNAANALAASNYPVAERSTLEVVPTAPSTTDGRFITQRITVVAGANRHRDQWVRRGQLVSGSWSWETWRRGSGISVVGAAGQPGNNLFLWDDVLAGNVQIPHTNMPLGTADLDVVTVPGTYGQGDAASATLARHYPLAGRAWIIEVSQAAGGATVQRATIHSGGAGATRGFYERRLIGGSWDLWYLTGSQRSVTAAGQPGVNLFIYEDGGQAERRVTGLEFALGTEDLNAITIPGVYSQGTGSNITKANNYPVTSASAPCIVEVLPMGGFRLQRLTFVGSSANSGRVIWERAWNGSTWTEWVPITATIQDETAGRAFYGYDPINQRLQLLAHSDTGWRDITAATTMLNGWTVGTLFARRRGYEVEIFVENLNGSAATSGSPFVVPEGLGRSVVRLTRLLLYTASSPVTFYRFDLPASGGALAGPSSPPAVGLYGSMRFSTVEPWLTVLPGTPAGTIPNA